MTINALEALPDTKQAAIILSGGLDSTIGMRLLVEKYGAENVHAISFDYGQKQKVELTLAAKSAGKLGVEHQVLKLDALNQIAQGYSANVDQDIAVPTLEEVLGDPAPITEVPNRNMIMLSLAAAYCQTRKIETLVCGIQVHDEYNYWDCTQNFIDAMNSVLIQNRMCKVQIIAPFAHMSKTEELEILRQLDGDLSLLETTITCYNPDEYGSSCGTCPSCSERLKAFSNIGEFDPVVYQVRAEDFTYETDYVPHIPGSVVRNNQVVVSSRIMGARGGMPKIKQQIAEGGALLFEVLELAEREYTVLCERSMSIEKIVIKGIK